MSERDRAMVAKGYRFRVEFDAESGLASLYGKTVERAYEIAEIFGEPATIYTVGRSEFRLYFGPEHGPEQ
ncbi:MAG: hypothetical protein GY871_03980 [Actinomycetales bacterium]|nr:hypothetical protein [Actinomycetales bacterium]